MSTGIRDFNVAATLDKIASIKAKRVALQFPEGLLENATALADEIRAKSGAEVVIMADCTYGACCIDDESALALGADLLVHYGHVGIVPEFVTGKKGVSVQYVPVEIQAAGVTEVVEGICREFKQGTSMAMCTTAQFLPTLNEVCPILNARGYRAELMPGMGVLRPGEILGCTAPLLPDGNFDIVLYLGDGRFHLEAAALANPRMKCYRFDPYKQLLTLESYDSQAVTRTRATVTAQARKLGTKPGAVVGLAVSTLGRQAHPSALRKLREGLTAKGIEHFTALMSDVSPASLDSFGNVDVWVQIACPRLSIDWGDSFSKPLLTTYEAFVAFGIAGSPEGDVSDPYPLDNWTNKGSHFWQPNQPINE